MGLGNGSRSRCRQANNHDGWWGSGDREIIHLQKKCEGQHQYADMAGRREPCQIWGCHRKYYADIDRCHTPGTALGVRILVAVLSMDPWTSRVPFPCRCALQCRYGTARRTSVRPTQGPHPPQYHCWHSDRHSICRFLHLALVELAGGASRQPVFSRG